MEIMILGIQILGIIFGLFMTYFTFLHYKRNEFNKAQFIFWEILWIGFIIIVIFPKLTNNIIYTLGVKRTLDLLTIIGLMFVTFITFYNYVTNNKIKRKLEELTRKESMKDLE